MGTWGFFPRGKARLGRDADHSPPSSAEVKKEYELYLLSPKCTSVEHNGTTLSFYLAHYYLVYGTEWQSKYLSVKTIYMVVFVAPSYSAHHRETSLWMIILSRAQ
jgi:hypothetical protein